MQFRKIEDPFSGVQSDTTIEYTDDNGQVWFVPEGHRFWLIYQNWLAEGNTPLPAA